MMYMYFLICLRWVQFRNGESVAACDRYSGVHMYMKSFENVNIKDILFTDLSFFSLALAIIRVLTRINHAFALTHIQIITSVTLDKKRFEPRVELGSM